PQPRGRTVAARLSSPAARRAPRGGQRRALEVLHARARRRAARLAAAATAERQAEKGERRDMQKNRRLGPDTQAVHAGKRLDPSGALTEPIFQTAHFWFSAP